VICDFGDVIVVPFPFVDIPANKRRPSVVLSNRAFNETNSHSMCMMITTATRSEWPSDIAISDLALAGLTRPCVLRWKLFTLPNALILRLAGKLGEPDRDRIVRNARAVMA
jgi:mRNA interferase MazF